MDRSRVRLLTLLVSSAAAVLAAWSAWPFVVEARARNLELTVLPREDEPGPARRPPETAGFELKADPVDPREWRYFLNERQVSRFAVIREDSGQVYDPWVYCRDAGKLSIPMPWKEHPDGKFTWKSNSLGCREDHEVATPAPDLRVLVAGDSHTCGVCNNAESYANRLEARLAHARPGRTVEVLNAGLGGYTFYSYLGTLLRLRDFAPAVFVVGVFGGNDFDEFLALHLRFEGVPWRQLTAEQVDRRRKAVEDAPEAMGQGFASLDAFRNWPESQELAVRGSVELCGEIQRTARVHGARVIVVYLPSPFEVSPYEQDERIARLQETLALDDADLLRFAELSDGFLNGVRALGVETIDMRAAFAAEPEPPFWRGDFHLNLRGHELVAAALEPAVASALAD
jgi:lysophospholipase L1-like esterase